MTSSAVFTAEQKQCIEFFSTPFSEQRHLLIEAGAGAGKTSVLIERVKWHLQNQQINPIELFLVTFSKDAAEQLRENAQKSLLALPGGEEFFSFLHISTIDSFFSDLTSCIYPTLWQGQQFAKSLQLVDEVTVMQELEAALYHDLKENLALSPELLRVIDFILSGGFKKGYSGQPGTLDSILKAMCNDTFLVAKPDAIRIVSQKIHPSTQFLIQKIHEIARTEYEKRVLTGRMTYADKTVFLYENLHENNARADLLPLNLKELIVDEYQDTNHIQHAILFQLVQKSNARMIVVGDPKQSIYGFRSASVDVFQSLKSDPDWAHIELKKNFRSSPALLQEINRLSQFTFAWENPSLPEEFQNSFFYREARKKYIAENPLEPGRNFDSEKCIHIVTSSLNEKNKNLNLKDVLFASIPYYLKKFKDEKGCHWHDIVILCERNKDIKELSVVLKKENIPAQFILKEKTDQIAIPALNVALALAKFLAYEEDLLDIYEILQSPISPLSHTEVEHFFALRKSGKEPDIYEAKSNAILLCLEKHRSNAKYHFFRAWQMLRHELVSLHDDEHGKNAATAFCTHMDAFAQALNMKLSSPYFRTKIEEKNLLLSLNSNERNQHKTPALLPCSLDKWELDFAGIANENKEDALEIKTVHSAKGLEWKYVCFLPKYGMKKNISHFMMAQSEKFIDITWLQDDTEDLSLVSRVQNEKFSDHDSHIEYDKKGEIKKIHWFSNLRYNTEIEYERQRIFYTAFTRAKNELILFQPMRHTSSQKGLMEELSKIKNSDFPHQKFMENDVYLRYIKYIKDFSENAKVILHEFNSTMMLQQEKNV